MTASLRDITLSTTVLSSNVSANNVSFHCVSPNLAFINCNVSLAGVSLPAGTTMFPALSALGWSFLSITGEKHFLSSTLLYRITISAGILYIIFESTAAQILSENIDVLEHIVLDDALKANIPNYSLMF